MGLTHYWRRPTELPAERFQLAIKDAKVAIVATDVPIGGFGGTGEPSFGEHGLVFNGVGAYACEPFEVKQVEFDRRGRAIVSCYCKTAYAPYDLCVRVAFICLDHHLRSDGFAVSSDDHADNWLKAREISERVLGYGAEFRLVE